jgi:hypothetical protein
MDYAMPSNRKSKNDKRAKARYSKYKKGGSLRTKAHQFEKKE